MTVGDAADLARFRAYRRSRDRVLRNEIVEANLGLARSLAARYRNRGVASDDLQQVAMIGLVKSVERFDPDRGASFGSFAAPTILGELRRHFRDRGWAVRVARSMQELVIEMQHTVARLEQHDGRSPTVPEIARALGVTEEQVLTAIEAGRAYAATELDPAFERPGSADERDALGERVALRADLRELLERLSPAEQASVELRFFEDLTQTAIAARLGVSQMQVSRLLRRALTKLRDPRLLEER
jgi:RNA polymerase sigma-B factor